MGINLLSSPGHNAVCSVNGCWVLANGQGGCHDRARPIKQGEDNGIENGLELHFHCSLVV